MMMAVRAGACMRGRCYRNRSVVHRNLSKEEQVDSMTRATTPSTPRRPIEFIRYCISQPKNNPQPHRARCSCSLVAPCQPLGKNEIRTSINTTCRVSFQCHVDTIYLMQQSKLGSISELRIGRVVGVGSMLVLCGRGGGCCGYTNKLPQRRRH